MASLVRSPAARRRGNLATVKSSLRCAQTASFGCTHGTIAIGDAWRTKQKLQTVDQSGKKRKQEANILRQPSCTGFHLIETKTHSLHILLFIYLFYSNCCCLWSDDFLDQTAWHEPPKGFVFLRNDFICSLRRNISLPVCFYFFYPTLELLQGRTVTQDKR